MSGKWKAWANRTDSRVPWLGQIPSHWKMLRLKWAVRSGRRGGTLIKGQLADEASDGLFPGYSASGQDVWVAEALYHQSGIVLSAVGARCGKAFRADGEWTAIANTHVLLPNRGFDRDFLWRIFDDERFWKKGGSAQPYVQVPDSLDREWAFPDLAEQRAIAAFLDRATAKIDALVAKKERLIELLQEKRTALISHAVTRGLNPNAPLRDSGIPWLGQIPAHWELRSLGTLLSRITYGFTNPMPVADTGPFMLTANDIGDGQIQFDSARRTTHEAYSRLLTDKSRPQAGDILITKDGTLGRIAVADGRPVCINQSVALLRPRPEAASNGFLQDALRAQCYQDCLAFNAGGTTIKHIYVSRLAKMPIALPPRHEQETISGYIGEQRNRLDALIAKVRTAIDRLQEYRTALISAAVTGQIDVREEARP